MARRSEQGQLGRVLLALVVVGALCDAWFGIRMPTAHAQSSSTGVESSTGAVSSTGLGPIVIRNFTIHPIKIPGNATRYCDLPRLTGVRAHDRTTLCIVVGGVFKMLFYPKVEDFSLLQIVTLNSTTQRVVGVWDSLDLWIQVEFSDGVSPVKLRANRDSNGHVFVVPFWTVIVQLNNGALDFIWWDDGCFGCGGAQCINDFCGIDSNSCKPDGESDCDVKMYVGWTGTDDTGRFLVSAGKRLSRFRQWSVSSAYDNAYATATTAVPDPNSFQWSGDATTTQP